MLSGRRGRRAGRVVATTLTALAVTALAIPSTASPASTAASSAASSALPAASSLVRSSGATAMTPTPMPVNASGDNPLAGRSWGVYAGPYEQWYAPWLASTGTQRTDLDQIARQPKMSWFGAWTPTSRIGDILTSYIQATQQGDPTVLVQFAMFRIKPWGPTGACAKPYSKADTQSYREWVDTAAAAIGSTYSAIVVQPDSPFATQCYRQPKKALRLIRYATKTFSGLPNASVYLETGAADWMHDDVANALKILIPGGVEYARGFAFNGTHYDATDRNVDFGAEVAQALTQRGITDKHFVINTAQNGAPFTGAEYGGNFPDNARVCKTGQPVSRAGRPGASHLCVTLGIPPTTDVANPAWGLTATQAQEAATYADAYLWFGRPWLNDQSAPFVMSRAVNLAQTTPFR